MLLNVFFSNMKLNLTQVLENSSALPTNSSKIFIVNTQKEDYNTVISICAVNAPFSLTNFLANAVVLSAFYKTSNLHSPTNILLACLTVSDLAVGLVVQPLFMLYHVARLPDSQVDFDVISKVFSISSYWLCGVSFAIFAAVGVDRLLALELHLRYSELVTNSRTGYIVFLIWVVCGLLSGTRQLDDKLFFSLLALLIMTCLFGTFFVYFRIYRIVHRHRAQIHAQEVSCRGIANLASVERLKKSAVSIFYVYCLFLLCYVPYLSAVISLFVKGKRLPVVFNATVTIVYINSTLNPLLYCWRIREIRKAVRQILFRLFCPRP